MDDNSDAGLIFSMSRRESGGEKTEGFSISSIRM